MSTTFQDNFESVISYAGKMPPLWLSQQIPDIYKPDPLNYPNQDTGLYHNYQTSYQDRFNPQNNSWVDEYLEEYSELEFYTPQNYYSDDGEFDEDYNY